jgi:Protein of unknown function (DUF3617)
MHFAPRTLLQAAVASLACTAAVTALVQGADFTKPNIKPGLWEVTTNPKMSGQMPIPEEQLAKMTPEQRARLQAAMQAGAGKHRSGFRNGSRRGPGLLQANHRFQHLE